MINIVAFGNDVYEINDIWMAEMKSNEEDYSSFDCWPYPHPTSLHFA